MTCQKCGEKEKMMSKKKWTALLFIFIIYILLGASYFHTIENRQEEKKKHLEEEERKTIVGFLHNAVMSNKTREDILKKLTDFCGKSVHAPDNTPVIWDYYHAVFFSITVVTTIGYGNLAPTTPESRIFMIVYGLIGIPFNGILFATLGEYFGRTFINIYKKWKNSKVKRYAANLGLITQITLYLIPGIIIFLVLPAFVIQHFEKWNYVLSFYYAFVTLTTIGFGDYVAGVVNKGFDETYFVLYQAFLIIWIIFGLGYLVMVIGFMTRGLRSKKMARLEKKLTHNIKTTQSKIWHGFIKDFTYLRRIMNELYMSKFKPVYRDEYCSTTTPKIGSQSFPDLRKLIMDESSPTTRRRRAISDCLGSRSITRVQSDSDLHRIDKEATFANAIIQPSELLANVANALTKSNMEDPISGYDSDGGVQGFSDSEILSTEMYGSGWTLGSVEIPAQPPTSPRLRAASEAKIPSRMRQDSIVNDWTWSGPAATKKIQELRKFNKFNKARTKGREAPKTIMERIRSSLSKPTEEDSKVDVEKQLPGPEMIPWDSVVSGRSFLSLEQETYNSRTRNGRPSVFSVPETRDAQETCVLEETSVADFLRALSSIHSRIAGVEIPEPRRKLGTASLNPPPVPSLLDLFNAQTNTAAPTARTSTATRTSGPRRSSMTPSLPGVLTRRRFSLHPVTEDQLMVPPPPYSQSTSPSVPPPPISIPPPPITGGWTAAVLPTIYAATPGPNPVHKQISRLRGPANARILYTRTRHNSLKDLRIERP